MSTTHGHTGTYIYRIWKTMRSRCYLPSQRAFKHYGGRGIVVCDSWRWSFENFLADMGHRPTAKHSLDRLDNNGPYSPDNCEWSNKSAQMKNRRPCPSRGKVIEKACFFGTCSDWAAALRITAKTVRVRVRRQASVFG